ncbi:MAG: ATP-binding cassette domain-containing protein [Candidatus Heimdallarchaeum aukensis]|uniref:ATP-binding cassette domain-containing protein n=1 Tax=Candidatus Heimdallarchaeum aukensis TaxID=2876573 RepID=A0A9Y1BKY7_9ARCH|nr:MAG: ATP-binding cassette domain-containing protein [Candidatus Heimdallarchaeum aukensis]
MIQCIDLFKIYFDPHSDYKVAALRGLDLYVEKGDLVSIVGPSGAGKTTLIKILSGLEDITGGSVIIDNHHLEKMSQKQLREFRFRYIGLINQNISDNLFSNLSVEKNLMIHKKLFYIPREQARREVKEILELLNLYHVRNNLVSRISGGEAMRLSLGAALAKNPKFLLLDEPTGQLDTEHTKEVINTIKDINENTGKTIVVVTHDIRFRNVFKHSFIIRDGRLVGVSQDMEKDKLEFMTSSSTNNRAYLDKNSLLRIPDQIKMKTKLYDVVEFDAHPAGSLGLFWNPDIVNREEIYKILNKPVDEAIKESREISYEEIEKIISRKFNFIESRENILQLKGVSKGYHSPAGYNQVIKNINLEVKKGDFVMITGPSGVGKTTLFNCITGLVKADKGEIIINNVSLHDKDEYETSMFRLKNIAYITQHNNLFEPVTVKDNLLVPYLFSKLDYDEEYSLNMVEECQIKHKLEAYPDELSAGEKQRASLSLALTRKTPILIGDEPTANLDSDLARAIIDVLMDVAEKLQTTVIICSHDLSLLRPGMRHIVLEKGGIQSDKRITKKDLKEIIEYFLQVKINDK